MTPKPWAEPELTARGRLPMHASRTPTACRSTARGGSSCSGRRTRPRATLGRDRGPRLLDHAGHLGPAALHQRPDALPGPATGDPGREPDGRLRAHVQAARGVGGRRVVLHVGAAESVLIVALDGEEVGVSKDSHLAAEFDLTDRLHEGEHTLRLTVVKWSDATFIEDQDQWWHGGITRSVFLYATGPRTSPTCDRHRAGARRRHRHARARGRLGWRPRHRAPGWPVEATLEGLGPPLTAVVTDEPPAPGGPGDWAVPGPPRRGVLDLVSRAPRAP